MPTTHFKKWAEYFRNGFEREMKNPKAARGADFTYFMMSNIMYMANRRKVGAERMKFNQDIEDAPSVTEKMKVLRSDPYLMEFIEKLAQDLFKDDSPKSPKSIVQAKLLLRHGDSFYSRGDFGGALEKYNEALSKVPSDEFETVVALYHRRMFCLMYMERWTQAYLDMDAIVLHPSTTSERALKVLTEVRNFCETANIEMCEEIDVLIDLIDSGEDYRSIPKKKPNNPIVESKKFDGKSVQGTTDAVKLVIEEGKGRKMVAAKKIESGDVVMFERAYTAHLKPTYYLDYCYGCFAALEGRFDPCTGCDDVRFCSTTCRDECCKSFHSRECGYIDALSYLTIGLDVIRMLIKDGYEKAINEFRNPKSLDYWTKNCLEHDATGFHSLFGHSRIGASQMFTLMFQAQLSVEMAKLLKLVPDGIDMEEFAGMCLKHICRVKTNSWSIYSKLHQMVGSGVFITFSMPNHSCEPNMSQVYDGDTMIASAIRPIHPGEEMTLSYGPHVELMEFSARQARLRVGYNFECACNGCLRDMSKYALLNYELPPPDLCQFRGHPKHQENQTKSVSRSQGVRPSPTKTRLEQSKNVRRPTHGVTKVPQQAAGQSFKLRRGAQANQYEQRVFETQSHCEDECVEEDHESFLSDLEYESIHAMDQ